MIFSTNFWRVYREEEGGEIPPGGGGGEPAPDPKPDSNPAPDPKPDPDPNPTSDPKPDPTSDPKPDPDPEAGYFMDTPENWRELIAGEDEGRLNHLKRYMSLEDVLKAGFEAQDRIRKGEMSTGLPENPTEEQLKEYREANGIPEAADKYELSLEEGLVLGDDDNRILEGVFKVAHENHISAEAMSKLTNAMLQGREVEYRARLTQDEVDKNQTNGILQEAWRGEYQANVNLVTGMLQAVFPEKVREQLESARMPDGTAVFNVPEIMVSFAELARKVNPAATVVPGSNNPVQAIDDEIKALEDRMGDDDWHKDDAAQARYRALLDAKASMTQGA